MDKTVLFEMLIVTSPVVSLFGFFSHPHVENVCISVFVSAVGEKLALLWC